MHPKCCYYKQANHIHNFSACFYSVASFVYINVELAGDSSEFDCKIRSVILLFSFLSKLEKISLLFLRPLYLVSIFDGIFNILM